VLATGLGKTWLAAFETVGESALILNNPALLGFDLRALTSPGQICKSAATRPCSASTCAP